MASSDRLSRRARSASRDNDSNVAFLCAAECVWAVATGSCVSNAAAMIPFIARDAFIRWDPHPCFFSAVFPLGELGLAAYHAASGKRPLPRGLPSSFATRCMRGPTGTEWRGRLELTVSQLPALVRSPRTVPSSTRCDRRFAELVDFSDRLQTRLLQGAAHRRARHAPDGCAPVP